MKLSVRDVEGELAGETSALRGESDSSGCAPTISL
jgi:hypothetical protein